MEEYTNSTTPTEEMFDDADLFTDEPTSEAETETAGESTETEKETETEAPANEDEKAEGKPAKTNADKSADAKTLRVKYNGEEKDITLDEAATLAQKGMNYDKIIAERDALKNAPEFQELDFWAQRAGMTRQEYVKYLSSSRMESSIRSEMDSLKSKYPDLEDKDLRELAEMRVKAGEHEAMAKQEATIKEKEQADLKPWMDFLEAYPEYKGEGKQLPPDVAASIEAGMTPLQAMLKHELAEKDKKIAELEQNLKIDEKNQENKGKALPSAASTGAEEPVDDFMKGLTMY